MLDLLGKGTDRGYSMIGVGLSAGLSGSRRARTVQDPLPALDLDWATNRSLPASYGPTPTFTRASTGTYFDGQGILRSAAVNGPRFNHVYNGTSWVSRGLLVEDQRTNQFTNSEDLTNAIWLKGTVAVSGNQINAPDGNQTADLVYPSSSGYRYIEHTGTTTGSGEIFTWSIFAKAAGVNWITMNGNNADTSLNTWFNLSNGTIGTTGSGVTAKIENVGNGWYRCSVSRSRTGTVYNWVNLCDADNSTNVTASGTNGVYFWGAQREIGSFPTSYIPTTSASVTRSADVCQITGVDFSGFWNGTEGSFVADFDFLATPADRVSPRVWYVSDGAYTNGIWVQSGTSDGFYVYQGGSSQAALTATALGAGVITRIASAYKLNDFAASFNGAAVSTDTSGNVPTVNRLEIGYMSDISGRVLNGHIARLRYYPTRLTNAKLQELAT